MIKPTLAAQLYTLRQFTQTADGLAESLRRVRAIGYQAVQVSGIGPIAHEAVALLKRCHRQHARRIQDR